MSSFENDRELRIKFKPLTLKPLRMDDVVAAVDTSTIKIGETDTGILIAVRGANVWKQDKRYRYMRFGPFIFHVTEENKKQIYETLENTYFSFHANVTIKVRQRSFKCRCASQTFSNAGFKL